MCRCELSEAARARADRARPRQYEAVRGGRLLLLLRHLPLSLRERYTFATAPVDPDDGPATGALLAFAAAYCHRRGLAPAAPPRRARRAHMRLRPCRHSRACMAGMRSWQTGACLPGARWLAHAGGHATGRKHTPRSGHADPATAVAVEGAVFKCVLRL